MFQSMSFRLVRYQDTITKMTSNVAIGFSSAVFDDSYLYMDSLAKIQEQRE